MFFIKSALQGYFALNMGCISVRETTNVYFSSSHLLTNILFSYMTGLRRETPIVNA